MFGIRHKVYWEGESLRLELEPLPRTDWRGMIAMALLCVVLVSPTAVGCVVTAHASSGVLAQAWERLVEFRESRHDWPRWFSRAEVECARKAYPDMPTGRCLEVLRPELMRWTPSVGQGQGNLIDTGTAFREPEDQFMSLCGFWDEPIEPEPPTPPPIPWGLHLLRAVAFLTGLVFLARRRHAFLAPVLAEISPGRWTIDGTDLGRVLAVSCSSGRLIIQRDDLRIWRSRPILPVDDQILAWMRSACTPKDALEDELEARLALRDLRGP